MELLRAKNVATHIIFPMVDSATPADFITGETVTFTMYARDMDDSAGFVDVTPSDNECPEVGGGLYDLDLEASEINYDMMALVMTASGGATTCILINTYVSEQIIPDGVWEADLSDYITQGSAGRRLRNITSVVILDGTCPSAPLNTNEVVLNGDASTVDGAYDPAEISIVAGAGAGQTRLVLQYIGATKTCIVDRDWKISPDDTSEYIITGDAGREHVNEGLAQAGSTALTIKLNVLASSDDDAYNDQTVFIRSGLGADQARKVLDYDGTTKIATVDRAWDVDLDATSAYVMLPTAYNTAISAEDIVEGGMTFGEVFRIVLAFVAGEATGGGTSEIILKSQDGNTDRITMTVDANGNRSAVVVDGG